MEALNMHHARQWPLLLLLLMAMLGGCMQHTAVVEAQPDATQEAEPDDGSTPDPQSPEADVSAGSDATIPSISVVSVADLKTKLSELQGKVVLLDLWATW